MSTIHVFGRLARAFDCLILASILIGCSASEPDCRPTPNIVDFSTDTSPIHDPTIIKHNETYYLYSSSALGAFYTSPDMRSWSSAGSVFTEIPEWLTEQVPVADHIGAPDIAWYNGKYVLFYQSHKPNTCDAATGLATNASLDPNDKHYEWVDQGLILRSEPFYEGLDIYCGNDKATFNAIDANFFLDNGTPWLVFGSTIGGIKLVELDPQTLKPVADAEFHTLAKRFLLRSDPIIEAPYLLRRNGYYYLFMSFNHCCLADKTQYQIRVGRATTITGPYYDEDGWPLDYGGGSLLIRRDGKYIGTGHADVWQDEGEDWLVHHSKDPAEDYKAYLNIRRLSWTEQDWPTVCDTHET